MRITNVFSPFNYPLFFVFCLYFPTGFDSISANQCQFESKCPTIELSRLQEVADVDELGKCFQVLNANFSCQSEAAWVEDELAFRAYYLRQNYLNFQEAPFGVLQSWEAAFVSGASPANQLYTAQQASNLINTKSTQQQILTDYYKIRRYIPLASAIDMEPLLQSFNDYPRFDLKLSAGYEYTGINKFMGTGFPRVGAMLFAKSPNIHFYSHAQLTSTAERSVQLCDSQNTNEACSNIAIGDGEKALEAEASIYLPGYHKRRYYVPNVFNEIGPVFSVTMAKANDVERFGLTAYAGIRLAFNPEVFNDVRVGAIEGNNSPRIDLRGQLPLFKITSRSRFYFGYNLSTNIGPQNANDVDIVKFYVSWNLDIGTQIRSLGFQPYDESLLKSKTITQQTFPMLSSEEAQTAPATMVERAETQINLSNGNGVEQVVSPANAKAIEGKKPAMAFDVPPE